MTINLIVKNILKSEKPSDIHIRSGYCPHIRLNGIITQAGANVVKKDIIDKFLKENLDKSMLEDLHTIGSVDFAAEIDTRKIKNKCIQFISRPIFSRELYQASYKKAYCCQMRLWN